uniref:Uncharacterized protein n=1 Tax=Solanum lycopersicum TaxID=4081 RepID=A0A3Q7ECZ0_SOLLC
MTDHWKKISPQTLFLSKRKEMLESSNTLDVMWKASRQVVEGGYRD